MNQKLIFLAIASAALLPTFGSSDEFSIRTDREELRNYLKGQLPAPGTSLDESTFGQCVTWGDVCILSSPFTSEEEIDTFVSRLADAAVERYQISGSNPRWTSTATNGGGLVALQPITLTYSFVPDGTSIPAEGSVPGSTTGGSNLFATMNGAFGSDSVWKPRFAAAFDRIGQLTGITYVEVSDDGASFPGSGGSISGSIRGDVRISMRPFAGAGGVLAYNYFPNTSDMVMDSADLGTWSSSTNTFRAFRNTVMHEHMHGLGYNHVDPVNNSKLMEPFLNTNFDGVAQDDIRGLQRQYGDPYEPNDTPGAAIHMGTLPAPIGMTPTALVWTDSSIEFPAEVDVFSFNVPVASGLLNISLIPLGTTYLQGPQGGSTANVNALAINNLQYQIFAPDGTTSLLVDNDAAIGVTETHSNLNLAPHAAGNYFIRVSSATATNDIQRYNITLSYLPPSAVAEWSTY